MSEEPILLEPPHEDHIDMCIQTINLNSPYLSLWLGNFGTLYPNKQESMIYFIAQVDRIQFQSIFPNGPMFAAEIIPGLTAFGGIDLSQCLHPFFSHEFTIPSW
jgi:hypothetical protein